MYNPLFCSTPARCARLLSLGLFAVAVVLAPRAHADSFTAFTNSANLIEGSGVFSGSTRVSVENPSIAKFDDFSVIDFNKASFGLSFPASSFSGLTLNLTDRTAIETSTFPAAGQYDVYYTLDTATSAVYTGVAGTTSPLKYTGSATSTPAYPQGLSSDGTPGGPSQFTSAPVFLSTQTYTKTSANTVTAISLAGIPTNVVLDALNGTNGSTGLRLILAPHDLTVAADFYGSDPTVSGGIYRPNLTFNAILVKAALNWMMGSGNWQPANTAGDMSWSGGPWVDGDVAVFGGTAGTVTLTGGVNASALQFDSTGYIIAGGGNKLTLSGSGVMQVTNSGDMATVNAPLSGTVGLNKVGAGGLALGSTQSDYTGTTTITAGALVVGANTNLGNASNAVALAGGTLRTNSALTLGVARTLSGAGTLDMSGGPLTVNGPVALTAVAIANGTVTFANASTSIVSVTVPSGSGVIISGTVVNGSDPSLPRATFSGDGTVQLQSDNSGFSSGFTFSKGTGTVGPTVTLGNDNALGTGILRLNAGIVQSAGSRLISTPISLGGSVTIGGATGEVGGAFEFNNGFAFFGTGKKILTINGTTTISSGIQGDTVANANNTLNKAGPGRLIINAFNQNNGGTTINNGTLEVTANGALGPGDITVAPIAGVHVTLRLDYNDALSPDPMSNQLSNIILGGDSELNLNFTGTPQQIGALVINGVSQPLGIYSAANGQGLITGQGSVNVTSMVAAPEPSTWMLLGVGAAVLAGAKLRRRARA